MICVVTNTTHKEDSYLFGVFKYVYFYYMHRYAMNELVKRSQLSRKVIKEFNLGLRESYIKGLKQGYKKGYNDGLIKLNEPIIKFPRISYTEPYHY